MNNPAPLRPDLLRTLLFLLVAGFLIGGSFWILRPFLAPLLWAAMIVTATWPLMRRVQALAFGRRWLAVSTMTGVFLLLFAIPIAYGVTAVVEYAPGSLAALPNVAELRIPLPPDWVSGLPIVGERAAAQWRAIAERGPAALLQHALPYLQTVGTWLLAEAGGLGIFVVQLLLTVVLCVVLYFNGESAGGYILRFARRIGGERGPYAVQLAAASVRAVALGIVVTALIQSALGGLGLALADVPYAGALAALMFVLCIAQLGPLLVLLPAVGWLWWTGATTPAIVLFVWSLAVGFMDNLIRPALIKRGADLPLMLIMAGVIGGLIAFGLIGLFLGPVILAVSHRLLDAWIEDGLGSDPISPVTGIPSGDDRPKNGV